MQARLRDLQENHKGLWQKIKDFFKGWLDRVRKMLQQDTGFTKKELQIWDKLSDEIQKQLATMWGEGTADMARNLDLTEDVKLSEVRGTENAATEGGEGQLAERDYPIDSQIRAAVSSALHGNINGSIEIGTITDQENRAINRFDNTRPGYKGKYTGGHHMTTGEAIRHALSEHKNTVHEALRAQLPLTEEDIGRTMTALKNGRARVFAPSQTSRGTPSILQFVQINGYTLYAEEILQPKKKNGVQNLMNHTMYKAPTLSTAASLPTSGKAQPKRQGGVLYESSISKDGQKSRVTFVADKNGNPALLYYAEKDGFPVRNAQDGGLILASSDRNVVKAAMPDGTSIKAGYIKIQAPFVVTEQNKVYSKSETNVSDVVGRLRSSGTDGFIFDYHTGDNYAIMFFNKSQITEDLSGYDRAVDGRLSEREADMPSDAELVMGMDEKDADTPEGKALIREVQAKQKQIETLREKLAEAKRQLTTTKRALNTKGIGNVAGNVIRDFGISDAGGKNIKQQATAILTDAYQKALDQIDSGAAAAA